MQVTFSVPFTRSVPVPSFPAPAVDAPYELPNTRARSFQGEERYFFGIATIDIDLSMIRFRCDGTGEVWDGERSCQRCPEGTKIYSPFADQSNITCKPCQEYEWSVPDRSLAEILLKRHSRC